MGADDDVHDSQAKSGTATPPTLVCASEALKRPGEKVLGESRPGIGHHEPHVLVTGYHSEPNGSESVAERVVDQIPEGLFEPETIAGERCCNAVDHDLSSSCLGTALEAKRCVSEQVRGSRVSC